MSEAHSAHDFSAPASTTADSDTEFISPVSASEGSGGCREAMSQEVQGAAPSQMNAGYNSIDLAVLARDYSSVASAGMIVFGIQASRVTWTLQPGKLTMIAESEQVNSEPFHYQP